MPEISIERAKKLLNPKNPHTVDLLKYFIQESEKRRGDNPVFKLGLKGNDLPELINTMLGQEIFPIVDKKLKLVIGADWGTHRLPMTLLERYHSWEEDSQTPFIDFDKGFRQYLGSCRGYYIGSMRPDTIVGGVNYRPDRNDKDLFTIFKAIFTY